MAICNSLETLLQYKLRQSQIDVEISNLQSLKNLKALESADCNSILSAEKTEVRNYYKHLYRTDEEAQALYHDYTEIPGFEEDIDAVVAKIQEEVEEIAAWEMNVDSQINTLQTEKEEIKAFQEFWKSNLNTNLQEDFSFGLGG